jgi:hypothetical protein
MNNEQLKTKNLYLVLSPGSCFVALHPKQKLQKPTLKKHNCDSKHDVTDDLRENQDIAGVETLEGVILNLTL